jgi:hypothetical protein
LRAERGNGDDIALGLFQSRYRDAKIGFLRRQQAETVPCIGITIPDKVEHPTDVDLKGVPPRIRIFLVKTFDKIKDERKFT